jgi:hypothetical protein
VSPGHWPAVPALRDFALLIAVEQRVARLVRLGRPKKAAVIAVATQFGVSVARVKSAHYRAHHRAHQKVAKCNRGHAGAA